MSHEPVSFTSAKMAMTWKESRVANRSHSCLVKLLLPRQIMNYALTNLSLLVIGRSIIQGRISLADETNIGERFCEQLGL